MDYILYMNNISFDNMVSQIYISELQLNKANTSDTEVSKGAKIRNRYNQVPHLTQDTALLDLHLSVSNIIVSTKI